MLVQKGAHILRCRRQLKQQDQASIHETIVQLLIIIGAERHFWISATKNVQKKRKNIVSGLKHVQTQHVGVVYRIIA
jgi:hypothetical protein